MIEWFEDFKKIVINKIGRINPKSVSKSYFCKIGKSELWETFIDNTKHLSNFPDTKKVAILLEGHLYSLPKCYCGNDVAWMDNKLSRYCSKYCSNHSADRASKISKTKLSFDEDTNARINSKRENTMIEKYGVSYNHLRPELRSLYTQTKLPEEVFNKLNSKEWLDNEYNILQKSASIIADELGCHYTTIIYYLDKHDFVTRKTSNRSIEEQRLYTQLKDYIPDLECNVWLDDFNFELDLYSSKLNLAIEVNGLYWHSGIDKNKHFNKTNKCIKSGITLFHFTDLQINSEFDKCIGLIKDYIFDDINLCKSPNDIVKVDRMLWTKYDLSGYYHSHTEFPTYFLTNGNIILENNQENDVAENRFYNSGYDIYMKIEQK